MIYEFDLGHNSGESIKNIYSAKDEGAVDHSTVTRLFKKFVAKKVKMQLITVQ